MRIEPLFCTGICLFLCLSGFRFTAIAQTYDRSPASACFQKQDFEGAISYLQSTETANSEIPVFNTDFGYALYMNEDYLQAKSYFQKAYLLQPDNFEAMLYLGQVYSILDNRDSSLFYYELLIKAKPGNYRYWQRAGNLCYQLGKFDSSYNYYLSAYNLNNRSGKIALALSNLLIRDKKIDLADSLLNEFLQRDTTDEDVIAKKIDISFKKSAYDTVIYWGEKLWRDSSKLSTPFVSLAYSYLNTQVYDKCLQLCGWLEVTNKATEAILYCEALAFGKKGLYKQSNEKLDECIKLSIRDDAHTYLQAKADNFENMKEYTTAVKYYDTAWFIFQRPYNLYFAGRLYDKFYNNMPRAKYYYRMFNKYIPVPRNNSEQRIVEYVKAYLQQKPEEKKKK